MCFYHCSLWGGLIASEKNACLLGNYHLVYCVVHITNYSLFSNKACYDGESKSK